MFRLLALVCGGLALGAEEARKWAPPEESKHWPLPERPHHGGIRFRHSGHERHGFFKRIAEKAALQKGECLNGCHVWFSHETCSPCLCRDDTAFCAPKKLSGSHCQDGPTKALDGPDRCIVADHMSELDIDRLHRLATIGHKASKLSNLASKVVLTGLNATSDHFLSTKLKNLICAPAGPSGSDFLDPAWQNGQIRTPQPPNTVTTSPLTTRPYKATTGTPTTLPATLPLSAKPTTDTPTTAIPRPTTGMLRPTTVTLRPTTVTLRPTTVTLRPTTGRRTRDATAGRTTLVPTMVNPSTRGPTNVATTGVRSATPTTTRPTTEATAPLTSVTITEGTKSETLPLLRSVEGADRTIPLPNVFTVASLPTRLSFNTTEGRETEFEVLSETARTITPAASPFSTETGTIRKPESTVPEILAPTQSSAQTKTSQQAETTTIPEAETTTTPEAETTTIPEAETTTTPEAETTTIPEAETTTTPEAETTTIPEAETTTVPEAETTTTPEAKVLVGPAKQNVDAEDFAEEDLREEEAPRDEVPENAFEERPSEASDILPTEAPLAETQPTGASQPIEAVLDDSDTTTADQLSTEALVATRPLVQEIGTVLSDSLKTALLKVKLPFVALDVQAKVGMP